jgi:hypothetical protein
MPDGPVCFTLDDGEVLTLPEDDLKDVYELLWRLAPKPGSVSTAAVVRGAMQASILGAPIALDRNQSAAMREAVALLRTPGISK